MSNQNKSGHFAPSNPQMEQSKAAEYVMCKRLLDMARDFYSNPENLKASRKWQAERESQKHS